jgi:hypothetical protein
MPLIDQLFEGGSVGRQNGAKVSLWAFRIERERVTRQVGLRFDGWGVD